MHYHAADGQPFEQPVLHGDILRWFYHPRVHVLQPTRVVSCLVGYRLACLVGEVAVCEEVHALHRVYRRACLQGVTEHHSTRLVRNNFSRREVRSGESGISVEPVIILHIILLVAPVKVMEHATADVIHVQCTCLVFQQVQFSGLVIGIHRLDCTESEGVRLIARNDIDAVERNLRNDKLVTQISPVRLHVDLARSILVESRPTATYHALNKREEMRATQHAEQVVGRVFFVLAEEHRQRLQCRKHVVVAGRLVVAGLDDVYQRLLLLLGQDVVQVAQLVVHRGFPARAYLVGAGDGCLAEVVQLAHALHDAGVLVARREVFIREQAHVLPDGEGSAVALDVVAVGGAVVFLGVEAVGVEEVVHRLGVCLFGCRDVFLWQREVPRDVRVAYVRDDGSSGDLCRFVGIDVDDFPFRSVLVPRSLERAVLAIAASGKVARLEGEHESKVGNLVVHGVERHAAVLEVVHRVFPSLFVLFLFGAHGRDCACILRINAGKGGFLVGLLYAVEFRVLVHVGGAGGKLEACVPVFAGIDVAGRAEGEQAGKELHIAVVFLAQPGQPLQVA